MELEKRAYGPDCTPEEKQAILDRLTFDPGKNCMEYNEVPVTSEYSVELMDQGMKEVFEKTNEPVFLLIDLTKVDMPSSSVRIKIKDTLLKYDSKKRFIHIGIFGLNALINVVASFIMNRAIKNASVTMSKTREDALKIVEKKQLELA